MELDDAIQSARTLSAHLTEALRDAAQVNEALLRFDTAAVLDFTGRRESFNVECFDLSGQLREYLDGTRMRPNELAILIAEVKRKSAALVVQDRVNRELAGRSLTFTKAYFNAILPKPQAYDRRGQATSSTQVLSTVSQRT